MSKSRNRAYAQQALGLGTLDKADLFSPRRRVRREQAMARASIRVPAPEQRKAARLARCSEPLVKAHSAQATPLAPSLASEADALLASVRAIGNTAQGASAPAPSASGSLMDRAHAWTRATLDRWPDADYRTTLGAALRLLWAEQG